MYILLLVVLPGALALGGCASSRFTSSGDEQFPPWHGEVAVLERLPPEGTYRLVGVVTVSGVALTSDTRMFDDLRALAAERGANAVVPQSPIRDRQTGDGGEERALAAYAIRRGRWIRASRATASISRTAGARARLTGWRKGTSRASVSARRRRRGLWLADGQRRQASAVAAWAAVNPYSE